MTSLGQKTQTAKIEVQIDAFKVPALVMAGGRGKRIELSVEKPLLPLLGRPLIDWVVGGIESAHNISEFYVVTSRNTFETEKHCVAKGLRVVRTEAEGYHDDLKQAIARIGISSPVLTVSSDVPAINGRFIDNVVLMYKKCCVDALTVLVPVEKRRQMGLSISSTYPFEGVEYCVSGINVINGEKVSEEKLCEYAFVTENIEAVLNVNTLLDLGVAEKALLTSKKNRNSV